MIKQYEKPLNNTPRLVTQVYKMKYNKLLKYNNYFKVITKDIP